MAKIATLSLAGASGNVYEFNVYLEDASWIEDLECVYNVSKRTETSSGDGTQKHIYIGQTENMAERHEDHHKQACFERHGYNCISIHRESSEQSRRRIEADLVASLDLPCNG